MEKLKGFTIELDLDGLKVDTGLADLKKSIRLVNSEMKSNMSVFDYGEKSLKKYGVQLDGLNKKLKVQETVVESAYKNYQKMVKEHGEGSVKAQEAAASYNYESAELNNLQRYVQKVTKEMQAFKREQEIQSSLFYKMGDSLHKFGTQLDSFSTKVRGIGTSLTKNVTTPIAGFVTLFGGMGFKRAMSLEQVEFMMDHISESTEEYEKRMNIVKDLVTDTRFGTAEIGNEFAKLLGAGANDESAKIFNEVAMNLATFKSDDALISRLGDMFTGALQAGSIDGTMINQFASAGVDVLKTLGNVWGKSTEDVRKILRNGDKDIQTVLNDLSIGILEGTKGVNGSTKAMGGMLEGSGKLLSGQLKNFNAAISQTGERLIKETGMFDGVKDALDELRNMLKSGELDTVLLPTFQGLQQAIESLVDITRKMFKWFSSLSDETKRWIGNFVGLSAVLGPLLTVLGIFGGVVAKISTGLGSFLKFLAPILKPMKGLVTAAGSASGEVSLLSRVFTFLTGPVGITIGIITALASALVITYKRSETFRDSVKKLGTSVKDTFGSLWSHIKPGIDSVATFFNDIKEQFLDFKNNDSDQLVEALTNITKGITYAFEFLKKTIDFVMPYVSMVVKIGWKSIQGTVEYFSSLILGSVKVFSGLFTGDWSKMWEGVTDILEGFVNFLDKSLLGQAMKIVKDYFSNLNKSTVDAFGKIKDYLVEKISEISKAVVDWSKNFGENFAKSFVEKKDQIIDALSKWGKAIKDKTIELSINIYEWFKELPGRAKDALIEKSEEISSAFIEWKDKAKKKTSEITDDLIKWGKELPGKVKDSVIKGGNVFAEWLEEQHELNKEFYSNLGKKITKWVTDKKDDVVDGFSVWGENIEKFFKELPDKVKEHAKTTWNTFKENLLDKYEDIKTSLGKWGEQISKFFDELPGKVKTKATDSWNNFKDNLLEKYEEIKKKLNKWKDAVGTFFEELPGKIREHANTSWKNFSDNFLNKYEDIKDGFKSWGKGISEWFEDTKGNMKDGAKKLIDGFVEGFKNVKDDALGAFETLKDSIVKWFKDLGKTKEIKDTGKEIVKNVKKGVEEGAGEEKQSFIDNIGAYIVDGFKYAMIAIGIILLSVGREIITRISEGMSSATSTVTKVVSDLWANIKRIFSEKSLEVYNSFKKSFVGQLISSAIKFALDFPAEMKKLWESAKRIFSEKINDIYNSLKNSFIGRIITNIINFSSDFKKNISDMWIETKKTFTSKIGEIRESIDNSFVGRMIKSVGTLKSEFIKLAGDMWKGLKEKFDEIVKGAKELPGRIGEGITNAKEKATNAMKSVGNGIIANAGKPFNKVVDGVNWVTGKLGIKTTIPKWDYPQYAKGTNSQGHKGGIAMIGEKGRELVKLPDGRSFLSPDSHTLLDLPKGTHVIPNKATEDIINNDLTHIPHYADGTKGWFSNIKDAIGDVWSYITNPSKLVDKFLDKISISKNMAEIPKAIVSSGWNYVKSKPYDYVKSMFKKAEDEGGNVTKPNFGGKFSFTSGYGQRWGKLHGGVDFAAPIGTPIPSQTSGKVSYAANGWNGGFGNLVKVKQGIFEHFYAHMSRILASVGQSVSKGDILGLVGNTGDSTGPHVHYELRKNGQRLNPFANGLKGFKTGGIIKNRMMAMLGEDGEEIVIPTAKNRRTDAMKLLALAAKKIGVEGGNYTRPGSLTSNNQDDGFKELLQATVEQNEYLSNMVDLLMQLLEKDVEAVVAFEPLYNMIKNRSNKDKYSKYKQRSR